MRLTEYTRRLVALAETVHRWLSSLGALDRDSRDRIATYAEEIASTLQRASAILARFHADSAAVADPAMQLDMAREFGRIAGYVETIVGVLQHHLDGRKLAGVKRRLEQLEPPAPVRDAAGGADRRLLGRLAAAEGYFRALADGLRA
ncbi:MAG: hypothetical protein NW216_02845 [Hyphomicrobium sp.]|nr:hypothetical protein [Hyphomicrobium sp.]